MRQPATPYVIALLGTGAVAWVTASFLPVLGLASAALLFMLPVLFAAARGGVGPGLSAAAAAAAAYNYFLLPPRYTFRVHGFDNLVSVLVLASVALVTSRLATRLRTGEAEALERARLSAERAELSTILAGHPAESAVARGLDLMGARYGEIRLLDIGGLAQHEPGFFALDLSAAAWAIHNGDMTGHGTEIMPAADWTFMPLTARNRDDGVVAALARPADGNPRSPLELDHLRQLCGLLGQCRDRDALEVERHARELLAESDRLRRALLAALAHDFRTPLTVVTGRLALIAPGNADAAEALAAAHRLDRLMNDLLGAARIEEGSLTPKPESLDTVDAIDAAFAGLTVPPGLTIHRAIGANLPFVSADPVLLHHILTNLIDNALRHASSAVTVGANVEADRLVLTVDDDGPGVPEAERVRIFERFARIEGGDRARDGASGSGLGLAIVKGFADAMAMTVSISAAPAGGARFVLAMPRAARRP